MKKILSIHFEDILCNTEEDILIKNTEEGG
jgi:hypothetical protein